MSSVGAEFGKKLIIAAAAKDLGISAQTAGTFSAEFCANVRSSSTKAEAKSKDDSLINQLHLTKPQAEKLAVVALAAACPDLTSKVDNLR